MTKRQHHLSCEARAVIMLARHEKREPLPSNWVAWCPRSAERYAAVVRGMTTRHKWASGISNDAPSA